MGRAGTELGDPYCCGGGGGGVRGGANQGGGGGYFDLDGICPMRRRRGYIHRWEYLGTLLAYIVDVLLHSYSRYVLYTALGSLGVGLLSGLLSAYPRKYVHSLGRVHDILRSYTHTMYLEYIR